jgi:phosphoribosylaminoimidazole-succinocarboxamide synthase
MIMPLRMMKEVKMTTQLVLETNLEGLKPPRRGKVRDIYDLGETLLIVATDRISAFDVVLPNAVPEKGRVLTQISKYWFSKTADIVKNHLISMEVKDYPAECRMHADVLEGRSMLVKKSQPLPAECIVRGYLSGSGLKEYKSTGSVSGIRLSAGLTEASRLPQPIFTPATKAETGHDLNISERHAAELVGQGLFDRVRALTLRLYAEGSAHADACGIIVADTKFEFGLLPARDAAERPEDRVILIDEMLTPDSSRFWPRDTYNPGGPQPSFDKQFVRDYLEQIR